MKIINKIYLFGLMALVAIMSGCQEDALIQPEPSPSTPDGCIGVYFPSTNKSVFELEPTDATEIELTIARTVTTGAADVPVIAEINNDNVFVVPTTVSFAAGEGEKTFKVTFPTAGEGTKYSLKLIVEGDQYVDPYSKLLPYVNTSVTRIAWEELKDPMVYLDGTVATFFGVNYVPMYAWGEKAETSDVLKYRFYNIYKVPTIGPDKDGIFDGYPYNDPGDFDEANDYVTLIEIDKKTNEVFMEAHEIGIDWSYGMFSIGSIYRNISTNVEAYPLGKLQGDKITFGESSLFASMKNYNDGGRYPANNPTVIYLTKEAYIADNLRIDDYNEIEYVEIEGAVREFSSEAFDESWTQSFAQAIDLDEDNEDSNYKNLFYLSNLYSKDYGLAFYFDNGKITIPENQETGAEVFGKMLYVSQSEKLKSTFEEREDGVQVYNFGLEFHYKDGTILGDFNEVFYYSEDPLEVDINQFIGTYTVTGPSLFKDEPAANMKDVKIAKGEGENNLVITGIDFAAEIKATYEPENSVITILPQKLADYGKYDITLLTFDGDASASAPLSFTSTIGGNLYIPASSPAFGYLLDSNEAGGFVDGYYNIEFIRTKGKSAAQASKPTFTLKNDFTSFSREKAEGKSMHNFKIQGKRGLKTIKNNAEKI